MHHEDVMARDSFRWGGGIGSKSRRDRRTLQDEGLDAS